MCVARNFMSRHSMTHEKETPARARERRNGQTALRQAKSDLEVLRSHAKDSSVYFWGQ